MKLNNKIHNIICKTINSIRKYKYSFLSNLNVQGNPIIIQPLLTIGNGQITCDSGVQFGYFPSPDFYDGYIHLEARALSSKINIGANTIINNRFTVIAESRSIIIGGDCLFGFRVTILDSDFHCLEPSQRRSGIPKSADVIIGNNVFIGSDVLILKGVNIGDNSIVAAGSVVSSSFPKNIIIGGNPARVIGSC